MKKPDDANPNATIQLDRMNADDVQIVDDATDEAPEAGDAAAAATGRSLPPPLPMAASMPPAAAQPPTQAPAAPPGKARNPLVIGVLFVVLLGVAITVGVKVGHALRNQPPVASASPSAPSASAVARPQTITMPTIEMMDEPTDAH
jgi:hypothetical protein